MKATDILEEMNTRGVKLWADSDRLKYDAPAGVLTNEDKKRLAECKTELLALLATGDVANPEPVTDNGKPPYLTEGNELIIPLFTPKRYRWWQGGQSIWVTLAELGAPLATWRRHAALRDDLLTEIHTAHCSGEVGQGQGFVYCVECGRYMETIRNPTDGSTD